jgi:hypothetical protein
LGLAFKAILLDENQKTFRTVGIMDPVAALLLKRKVGIWKASRELLVVVL